MVGQVRCATLFSRILTLGRQHDCENIGKLGIKLVERVDGFFWNYISRSKVRPAGTPARINAPDHPAVVILIPGTFPFPMQNDR